MELIGPWYTYNSPSWYPVLGRGVDLRERMDSIVCFEGRHSYNLSGCVQMFFWNFEVREGL